MRTGDLRVEDPVALPRSRRRELEACLQAFDATGEARSLRQCIEHMGPLFRAYGRYLATRMDIVPDAVTEELARIPDRDCPMEPVVWRNLFARDFGCAPEDAFQRIELEPFDSRLFWQAHRARLGKDDVVVKIVRPELADDAGFLDLLSAPLRMLGTAPVGTIRAMEDFVSQLPGSLTLEGGPRTAALFARDASTFDSLAAPVVYEHLCSGHVAVYRRYPRLDAMTGPSIDTAQTLYLVWLRQALQGLVYPVDPSAANIALDPGGSILFEGGPFGVLPPATKVNLWHYLLALESDNVDEAFAYLANEVLAQPTGTEAEELRRQMRQMVPFRDGPKTGFVAGLASEGDRRLTAEVLIHWRFASAAGCLTAELVSFYRGLLTLARTAQQFAPGYDPLAQAVSDLRLRSDLRTAKDQFLPAEMAGLMERYGSALLSMPEQLDRVLDRLSDASSAEDRQPRGGAPKDAATVVSLLLALAGAVFLLNRIVSASHGGASNRVAVGVFVVVGLVLLRLGSRLE